MWTGPYSVHSGLPRELALQPELFGQLFLRCGPRAPSCFSCVFFSGAKLPPSGGGAAEHSSPGSPESDGYDMEAVAPDVPIPGEER